MKKVDIGIVGIGSISPLGNHADAKVSYKINNHNFSIKDQYYAGQLSDKYSSIVEGLKSQDKRYRSLDRSTLLGMYSAEEAIKDSNWEKGSYGVTMGTSRGAAETLENAHEEFLKLSTCATTTSPITTMGNLSYWVGQHIQSNDLNLSHSITCSSSLHALLSAISWIEAGWQERFIVGGAEAPLTAFFQEQMKALRIAASYDSEELYPNHSLKFPKDKNTMILGEGACSLAIEKTQKDKSYQGRITGVGFGSEAISHHTSISNRGENIYKAMKMATQSIDLASVDAIVMHAPGTILGDQSEYNAVVDLFGKNTPYLTSNKWKIGHTLGASGTLSIEMGLIMLEQQSIISPPFVSSPPQIKPQRILINAMGFGGNAVSVLIEK